MQYQSDESTDVIAQPKLYFGVSGPVVDTTAPTVTIVTPADKAVYQQNEVVPVQYACVDVPNATSVVTCDGDLLNDSLLDTSTPGTYTFTVNSADGAGNDASVTHTYTVAPVIVLPIMPTSKDECFKNGWKAFGSMFANQGQCVSSVSGNNRSAR